jgi:hypothetical protein
MEIEAGALVELAGGVAAAVVAGLDGAAALPVWANADNANVAAPARRKRRNLLFIVSVELLGTWFRE